MATLFGIASCDTVKKARAWMAAHDRAVEFRDFKKTGVPVDRLDAWLATVGWERLLNRQGSTWRKLDVSQRDAVVDGASARQLMLEASSIIKRPVVEWADGAVTVGFDPQDWAGRR